MIMGGGWYELSIDDYILGAMFIYIDVIAIFFRVMEALRSFDSN